MNDPRSTRRFLLVLACGIGPLVVASSVGAVDLSSLKAEIDSIAAQYHANTSIFFQHGIDLDPSVRETVIEAFRTGGDLAGAIAATSEAYQWLEWPHDMDNKGKDDVLREAHNKVVCVLYRTYALGDGAQFIALTNSYYFPAMSCDPYRPSVYGVVLRESGVEAHEVWTCLNDYVGCGGCSDPAAVFLGFLPSSEELPDLLTVHIIGNARYLILSRWHYDGSIQKWHETVLPPEQCYDYSYDENTGDFVYGTVVEIGAIPPEFVTKRYNVLTGEEVTVGP